MIQGSTNIQLPKQLSDNGIQELFAPGPHMENREFILQVIKLTDDCEESKICFLSDGHVHVRGLLKESAKMKAIRGELVQFDVIKIDWTKITLFGLEKDPAFQLNNCDVFGIRMLNSIGSPVSYVMYYHNNYMNKNGSSRISEGQKVQDSTTLDQLLQSFPQVPKKWVLKAKITKKPDTINMVKPFMIVRLLDSKMRSIEGVFFGKQARDYFGILKYNHEYLFSNGLIKLKKNNSSQFQIKFTQHSQIIPIQTMKTVKTKDSTKLDDQVKIKQINALQNGQIINITAKVLRVKRMARGRSLQVVDSEFQVIEIVLWEEFTDQIIQGETYIFFNVRIKHYNGIISLQSLRHKTQVRFSFKKIEKSESNVPKVAFEKEKKFKNDLKTSFKDLINSSSVKSILEVTEMKIQQRAYVDVNGFLIINSYPDYNKFFKVECKECGGKEAGINPICCRKCSSQNLSIRWNVRAQLVDEKEDIKVILNEQICQKLFKWYSRQAFTKFHESLDEFMKKMESVSYIEGIYKIKINPYNGSIYYNILERYREDSRVLLSKAYKQLKKTMKQFVQIN